jgi:D-sedoheptulose 7-phosphate isomerase
MKKMQGLGSFIDSYVEELKHCLDALDRARIAQAVSILMDAYRKGKNVFIMGNGGSASTASHMACDLSKGTISRVYNPSEGRFRVYSLTDNVALLTAFGNDVSYEEVFVQQLRNLLNRDDVVIVISGSGNSPNVVKAVRFARRKGARTIGLLGFKTGGKLGTLVDCPIIADSRQYGPSEDIHLVLDHIIITWITRIKHGDVHP